MRITALRQAGTILNAAKLLGLGQRHTGSDPGDDRRVCRQRQPHAAAPVMDLDADPDGTAGLAERGGRRSSSGAGGDFGDQPAVSPDRQRAMTVVKKLGPLVLE